MKVGNKVWLDDAQAFVEELLVLEEGGSEGDTWRLFRLKLPNGERCIIEEEGSNQNLYALHSTPLTDIDWEYDNSTITVSSEAASIDDDSIVETKRSNVTYRSGATADGRELLQFRGETWVYLSGLINYGNDDQWLASAQCPASSLQRYSAPDASFDPKLGWIILGGVVVWGVADILFGGVGFIWAFCTLGIVGVLLSSAGQASKPRLILSAAYAVWLFLVGFVHDFTKNGVIERLVGELWSNDALLTLLGSTQVTEVLLALYLTGFFALLLAVSRRGFYVFGDGSVLGSAFALLIYTVLLFALCLANFDFDYFLSWTYYFGESPHIFIWWAFWAIAIFKKWKDYRRVPLTIGGFHRLRSLVIRDLRSEHPLDIAQRIGDRLDDLADAIHLSDDAGLRSLKGHCKALYEAAEVFRGLDETDFMKSADTNEPATQLRLDLDVLAQDLESIESDSEVVRLSPMLRLAIKS